MAEPRHKLSYQQWGIGLGRQLRYRSSASSSHTMSNTHPSLHTRDGRGVKDVSDHTIGLDLVESSTSTTGDYTSGILTSDRLVLLL
jgi:hypothetical protein